MRKEDIRKSIVENLLSFFSSDVMYEKLKRCESESCLLFIYELSELIAELEKENKELKERLGE